jgi:hypothetical protein
MGKGHLRGCLLNVIVKYGPETMMYGPPHGYMVTCRGIGQDLQMYGYTSAVTTELVEAGGWFVLGVLFENICMKLKAKGATPQWWDCGGWWREEWSENDEYGDYKW